jgi:hypothetical protein
MRQLATRFEVDAGAERVYDLVADPRRHSEWQTAVRQILAVSGRGGAVGSSYTARYRVAGRTLEARFVVTAADRPRLHRVTGTGAAGVATWTTTIAAGDDGRSATVAVALDYELAGNLVGGLMSVFAGRWIARGFHRSYGRLRTLVERETHDEAVVEQPAPSGEAGPG